MRRNYGVTNNEVAWCPSAYIAKTNEQPQLGREPSARPMFPTKWKVTRGISWCLIGYERINSRSPWQGVLPTMLFPRGVGRDDG